MLQGQSSLYITNAELRMILYSKMDMDCVGSDSVKYVMGWIELGQTVVFFFVTKRN